MVEFPSLAAGEWIQKLGHDLPARSISELRATLEAASCVSMFKIRFQFPTYERYHPDASKGCFHPLSIRCRIATSAAASCSPQAATAGTCAMTYSQP